MPIPLAIPIALGAAKFLQGLFGHKSDQKRAEAERKAQEAAYQAQLNNWNANESGREARTQAAGQQLVKGQGSLAHGAPDYTIDPALLGKIGAPRPFAGSLPADPRAGLGYSWLSGLAGGGADVLKTILLGKLQAGAGGDGIEGGVPAGAAGEQVSSVSGSSPMDVYCSLNPSVPMCMGRR